MSFSVKEQGTKNLTEHKTRKGTDKDLTVLCYIWKVTISFTCTDHYNFMYFL